jgi:hypothetical protein
MKLVPFIVSTVAAAAALILGVKVCAEQGSLASVQSENLGHQEKLLKLQQEMTKLEQEAQTVNQAYQLKQGEAQAQQREIEAGASVAQKYGPPILRDIGYLAEKHKNEKLRDVLKHHKLESFVPNAEQIKAIDEQLEKAKAAQAAGGTPAPTR